jgi:hypothetical protein
MKHRTALGPKDDCIGKLDRYKDRKFCGKLPVNETVETPVTSACCIIDVYYSLKFAVLIDASLFIGHLQTSSFQGDALERKELYLHIFFY